MAQPQGSTIRIDAALSNFSKKLSNDRKMFIADILAPRVRVAKSSDKYFIYGSEALIPSDGVRKPGTRAQSVDWTLSNTAYLCEELAFEHSIPDPDRDNADPAINLEEDAVSFLTEKLDINRENRVAVIATTTSNYASSSYYTTLTGNHQWSVYTSTDSDPEEDIKTAKLAVYNGTGRMANTIILPYNVAETLAHHPNVVELRKYTNPTLLNEAGLPPVIWGLKVAMAGSIYNSAKKGQTASYAELWGKNVVVAYVDPNPGRRSINFMTTFDYKGRVVEKYREDAYNADVVRVREQGLDEVVTCNTAAYLIAAAIA